MTAKSAAAKSRPRPANLGRPGAAALLAAALLAMALAGACTTRQVEDFVHAGGKIAYDSMKARQQSE